MNAAVPQSVTRYDIKAIAHALGVKKRTAEIRAVNESWPFDEEPHPGKPKRFYPQASLPKAVRDALISRILSQAMTERAALPAVIEAAQPPASPATAVVVKKKKGAPPRKVKAAADLTDKNKAYQENALILCRAIEDAQAIANCTEKRAIIELAHVCHAKKNIYPYQYVTYQKKSEWHYTRVIFA